MATVVLISCAKKKLNHAARAKDLYISHLFKLSWQYAQSLNADKIFILSAMHHLLDPEKVIGPYNLTLKEMSKGDRECWAAMVLEELDKQADLENDNFIFLAGRDYIDGIEGKIVHKEEPLKGLPYGKRLLKLKELTKGKIA